MKAKRHSQKAIQVCAHWQGMTDPIIMGTLYATPARRKEIFSFEYDPLWLKSPYARILDPDLALFTGPQYTNEEKDNFGLFLDSSPDRWGRVLMQRREAQQARIENRPVSPLMESDYLLGVYDAHRMGAMRFRFSEKEPFLDNQTEMSAPPWTKLRDLEYASLQLERQDAENDSDYMKWLKILIAPGGSLGGARPKASVLDKDGHPWIAKFPSRNDEINIGKWEYLLYQLAQTAGIETSQCQIKQFSGSHDTFLTKRFDRTENHERKHFSSAMTLLGKQDGDGGETGVSYLDLADFLIKNGAQVNKDLEQLWRRIIFYICTSNIDDHLRNHGFLLQEQGWVLAPAYDMNPVATGNGLTLNITQNDNTQDLELVRSVASLFRISRMNTDKIIHQITTSVRGWKKLAEQIKLPTREIDLMANAFRIADNN